MNTNQHQKYATILIILHDWHQIDLNTFTRQSDKYFQRYAPETNCLRTAQRRNIIIFSSATLRIEFRLKIL